MMEADGDPGHLFRCWYPVGSPRYLEIKAKMADGGAQMAGSAATGGQ
jgi:hypothetical protein